MGNDTVDETAVYSTTGNPHPQDIEQIMQWLLNDSFAEAYNSEAVLSAM